MGVSNEGRVMKIKIQIHANKQRKKRASDQYDSTCNIKHFQHIFSKWKLNLQNKFWEIVRKIYQIFQNSEYFTHLIQQSFTYL